MGNGVNNEIQSTRLMFLSAGEFIGRRGEFLFD